MFFCYTEIYNLAYDGPNFPPNLEEMENYSEEVMVDRLVEHHRHIDGIVECFKNAHKPINADQPKADVISQGRKLTYVLITMLEILNKHTYI